MLGQLGHNYFFPNPFQFSIHLPSNHWVYLLTAAYNNPQNNITDIILEYCNKIVGTCWNNWSNYICKKSYEL
jgi:hypothetical protein